MTELPRNEADLSRKDGDRRCSNDERGQPAEAAGERVAPAPAKGSLGGVYRLLLFTRRRRRNQDDCAMRMHPAEVSSKFRVRQVVVVRSHRSRLYDARAASSM